MQQITTRRRGVGLLPDQIKIGLIQQRNAGQSLRQCVKWLQKTYGIYIPRETLRRRLQNFIDNPVSSSVSISEQVQHDKQIETLRSEVNHYRKLYSQVLKDSTNFDKLIRVAHEVTSAIPPVSIKSHKIDLNISHFQMAVAPLCDTHIGEFVDYEQMSGLNAYDMDIFNKRLRGWATKIVELIKLREKYVHIPVLYVPLLGDMISGDIHLELIKTNVDRAMNQMIRGAHMIAQALVFLAQYFDSIEVPCVIGNHGRMTIKPPAKDKYVDWDYMLYQWISAFCKNQTNIHFSIPKSFMHVFEVANKKILIMHGDSIKGGFAGIPYYGINRAVAYLRQTLQLKKTFDPQLDEKSQLNVLFSYFDAIMIGHFHKHEELDMGTGPLLICGCFKGADEFSFARLHLASKSTQILTFWHPTYGYLGKDIVFLDRYDHSDEKFEDVLPDVWINSMKAGGISKG